MQIEEIEKKVHELLSEKYGNDIEIKDLKSIQFVELVVKIEDEFGIEIDFDDMDVDVIGNNDKLIQYLYDKINA